MTGKAEPSSAVRLLTPAPMPHGWQLEGEVFPCGHTPSSQSLGLPWAGTQ